MQDQIQAFCPGCPQEEADRRWMLDYLQNHPNAYSRLDPVAHMTVSAWVLGPDGKRVALVHHNIYNSWSWVGGHADGQRDLLKVAMQEVREETGIKRMKLLKNGIFSLECLAVMGHEKRGAYVPSHIHMNVTYLLQAEDETLREKPDENSAVGWFTPEEALRASTEPWMVQRVYRKLVQRTAIFLADTQGGSR